MIMYAKLEGASPRERATFFLDAGMRSVHEMYAFTSDGRLRIAALSTVMFCALDFFSFLFFFTMYGDRA